jgi:Dockerin type I domain
VNDPPSGTDKTLSSGTGLTYPFTTADFGFTDPLDSPANILLYVKIVELPTSVKIKNGQDFVQVGSLISAANIANGLLIFDRSPGLALAGGSNLLKFHVQDSGGTANGGRDLDPTPNTLTLHSPRFNVAKPLDVNNDGYEPSVGAANGIDPLEIINYINAYGRQNPLDPNNQASCFCDTNNDYAISDIDVIPVLAAANGIANSWFNPLTNIVNNNLDINADHAVTAADLQLITNYFAPPPGGLGLSPGPIGLGIGRLGLHFYDVNNNGQVNNDDLNLVKEFFSPQGANKTIDVGSAITYPLTTSDFGFTDPFDSPPDNLLSVIISTPPASGKLLNNGQEVVTGGSVSAANIADGKLMYSRAGAIAALPLGIVYFEFQVKDDGGTAAGGFDLDPVPNFIVLELTSPWHNNANPFDVSGDGYAVSYDAIAIINWVNANGPGPVPLNAAQGPNFYDVNNDFYVNHKDQLFATIAGSSFTRAWHNQLSGKSRDINANNDLSDDQQLLTDYLNSLPGRTINVPTGLAARDSLLAMLSNPRFYDVNDDGIVNDDDKWW